MVKSQREPGGPEASGGGTAAGRSMMSAGESEPELPPVRVPELSSTTTRLKNEVQSETTQRPEVAASVVKAWLSADN